MFTTISWQEYFTFLVTSIAIYYLVIYLLYFRNTGEVYFHKNQSLFNSEPFSKEKALSLFDHESYTEESLRSIVHACMDELNALFENYKASKAVKSEVLYGLHRILQKYPSLRNSEYKESISNVIAIECENICSIHLSAGELKDVWFG